MFAKNIRFLRGRRKWLQSDLSARMGYKSSATVNKWETGVNVPPYRALAKLSEIFGVSPDDLMNKDLEAAENELFDNIENLSTPAATPLPILGTICAGEGLLAEENYQGLFFVDKTIKADLCLTVQGDSMEGAGVYDGDRAFVRRNFECVNGRIYAVLLKGENVAILRRVYWEAGRLVLLPCNTAYSPLVTTEEETALIGECVGVYHSL